MKSYLELTLHTFGLHKYRGYLMMDIYITFPSHNKIEFDRRNKKYNLNKVNRN